VHTALSKSALNVHHNEVPVRSARGQAHLRESAASSSNAMPTEYNRETQNASPGDASVDLDVVDLQTLNETTAADLCEAGCDPVSTTAKAVPAGDKASQQTQTARNGATGQLPTMIAQEQQDPNSTSELAHGPEKQPIGWRKVDAATTDQSELTMASTTRRSALRSTQGRAHSPLVTVDSHTAPSSDLSDYPTSNDEAQPNDTGASSAPGTEDPAFEGVFEIERLLERQRSGKILWLKIKWKGIPTGSWEKAEHILAEIGEEAYQELLETKPRKKRKKAAKW
jgi:hypothetical protein